MVLVGWAGEPVQKARALPPIPQICVNYSLHDPKLLTSTPTVADGDSQTSRFEFLLLGNCLHPKRDFGLMFAPQTNPARESGFYVSNTKRNSSPVLILGMFTIAPSYASRSTDFAVGRQHLAELRSQVAV
ncbi:MAG: hypothetical protein EAZ60_03255 [Oscillatoriales cyanobacterium]|nr:MAG: hypothetical protein EAZ83_17380 [Oscillatoriales cyanobacterium]TAE95086.1 MAG: hypothetical protein EAZ79_20590 [Oscillatoriales cyanobacterium]TAF18159.1 MAG: hypothetical protein EAZ73_18675 [Oscillatoriales cyanobacterium]TAF37431.1 MAG: hypothetical protein EAZ69_07125 [Oscillatoriales cyanobacterium]TAF58365.1 MAG: hypothetical protein EAZ60_03255 [Oscillatoriales cyanobacterium]